MDVLTDELWAAIKPVFLRAWPNEAIVAIWKDGSWRELANTHPDPTRAFSISHEDQSSLLVKRPALYLHSHPNGSAEPSDRDTENQLATGWTWGIVAVHGNLSGVYDISYPEIWGPEKPVEPLLGRSYLWGVRDCWTLCEDYYRASGRILDPIPRVREPGNHHHHARARDPFRYWPPRLGFKPIEREQRQPGDLAIMFWKSPIANHCAVYLGEGKYLHQLIERTSEEWRPQNEERAIERYAIQFWRLK
ncbi:NlpC/P60 family protein [uncultured Novosphingobium sp.]|uniref:NlpC/P60 family protein n=1 Tax=uncultured Novosphingobium sp. TaxID=292277 RepID=UPI002586EA9B|nr:NlpC/P60 family protein [uncultured Novosphingobium sp.]